MSEATEGHWSGFVEKVVADPLKISCPECGSAVGEPCVKSQLAQQYGDGETPHFARSMAYS